MSFDIPEYMGPREEDSYTNALSVPIRDSPENVRGWRLVGIYLSCVPDAAYPPDWNIIRAAQEMDPDLRYLCARWVFKPEAKYSHGSQPQVFVRHALGRYVRHPQSEKQLFFVDRVADDHYPAPNQLDRILPDFDDEIVPPYAALCWDVYWQPWVQLTKKQFKQRFIDAPVERVRREKMALAIEMAGRQREAQKFWDRCLENISDVEWKQWLGKQRLKEKTHRAQQMSAKKAIAAQKRREAKAPKLTFDLGGH